MNKKKIFQVLLLAAFSIITLLFFTGRAASAEETDTYSITYILDGGQNKYNPETYSSSKGVRSFYDPSDKVYVLDYPYAFHVFTTHYEFAGWYSDAKFVNEVTSIPAGTKGDITLYAKWIPRVFSIKYNLNGGSLPAGAPYSYSIADGEVVLPTPTRYGHKFLGWKATSIECPQYDDFWEGYIMEEPDEEESFKVIPKGSVRDLVLEARWADAFPYKIIYTLNGGTNVSGNPDTYTVDDEIVLQNPYRKGYVFKGWYTDSQFRTAPVKNIPRKSQGTRYLYAKWEPTHYSIGFSGNTANAGIMQDVAGCTYGTTVKLPGNAFTKKGYSFTGWNTKADGTGTKFTNGQNVTNLTSTGNRVMLYAQWTPVKYEIAYGLSGGTNNKNNPSYYTINDTIKLANPVKKGYVFCGWYRDTRYKNCITVIKKGSAAPVKLYAKWQETKYGIRFAGNGATAGSVKPFANIPYSKAFYLRANAFTRKGYTFDGWNTKADGTGTKYSNKAKVKGLSAKGSVVTLYAQWKPVKYGITYYLNGGTNNKNNPSYYTINDTVKLANPVKKGYVFCGWYRDTRYKNRITVIKKGSAAPVKLYAKWQETKYGIRFAGNGATAGSVKSFANIPYSKAFYLRANAFTRKGYTFDGWNTKADGTGTKYSDKAKVKGLSAKGSVVTLYAQWKPVKYGITYYLNGGTQSRNNTSYYTTNIGIQLKNPSRTGYTFTGWYADSKLTKKVSSIAKGCTGKKVLYAGWRENTYSVVYNGNGSTSGVMSESTYLYNAKFNLKRNRFVRSGYTFNGWNTKADGTGISFTNEAEVTRLAAANRARVTLFAQWRADFYTITYNTGGAKLPAGAHTTYKSGESYTLPAPELTGCVFDGWYTDPAYLNRISVVSGTGNITLYAKWKVWIEITCSGCRGYGKVACLHCNGRGGNTCSICHGRGQTTNYILDVTIRCSACYGSGTKSCMWCIGTGRDTCTKCGGRGYVRKLE